jgi:hypothetical protein
MEGMQPTIDVPTVVRAPENLRETLAFIGLGSRTARAAFVSTLATSVAYASKWPQSAFTPEGKMKKFSIAPVETQYGESDTTNVHFAAVPVMAFLLTYVFF